ncbi:hypothetical protein PIB30_070993, partial [Stylosanthes scabra]|nr:hypothetical protein [Stylosanthes scabra]
PAATPVVESGSTCYSDHIATVFMKKNYWHRHTAPCRRRREEEDQQWCLATSDSTVGAERESATRRSMSNDEQQPSRLDSDSCSIISVEGSKILAPCLNVQQQHEEKGEQHAGLDLMEERRGGIRVAFRVELG